MASKTNKNDTELRSAQHQAALEEYEKGVRLLQQKDYKKAIPRFEAVISKFPGELALGDRSAVYLKIARGEGQDRTPLTTGREPETAFEVGVYLLNRGEAKDAVRHLERATEHQPEEADIHLTLAAAQLLSGEQDAAIATIGKAVELDPKVRFRARNMVDFDSLDGNEEYEALIYT